MWQDKKTITEAQIFPNTVLDSMYACLSQQRLNVATIKDLANLPVTKSSSGLHYKQNGTALHIHNLGLIQIQWRSPHSLSVLKYQGFLYILSRLAVYLSNGQFAQLSNCCLPLWPNNVASMEEQPLKNQLDLQQWTVQ